MPQGPIIKSKWYKATTPEGGSFEVFMSHGDMQYIEDNPHISLHSQIAHECWCQLWKDPTTARILRKLCGEAGQHTHTIKAQFVSTIQIEDL